MTTREQIIEAAAQLFAEHGYEGMTLKAIAQKVGIKAPSIYAYYKNKEDVLLHIYKNVLRSHYQLASDNAQLNDTLSVKQQFEQLLQSIMLFQLKEADKMKIFIRMVLLKDGLFNVDIKQELNRIERAEHVLFRIMIEKGIDQGEIREGNSKAMASLLICLLDGLFWSMQRYDEQTHWTRFYIVWNQFWEQIRK